MRSTPHSTEWKRRSRFGRRSMFGVGALTTTVGLALLSFFGGGVSSASQTHAAKTHLRIAFLPSFVDPYFTQEASGAIQEAKKLGVTVKVQNAAGSSNTQLTQESTLLGSGVNGIIVVAVDQSAGPALAKAATKAAVPLVASDNTIDNAAGKAVPFVGFKWAQLGTQVGTEVAKLFKAKGWAPSSTRVLSVVQQALTTCNQRTNAETKAFLAAEPGMAKDVIDVPYDGTSNAADTAAATIITANPQVTHWLSWSCNDDGVVGALQAVSNAGVSPSNAIGVGLGGNLACQEWSKGTATGFDAAVYANPALTGALAVQELYDNVTKKKSLPASVTLDGVLVTQGDYKKLMKGYIGCP